MTVWHRHIDMTQWHSHDRLTWHDDIRWDEVREGGGGGGPGQYVKHLTENSIESRGWGEM